MDKCYILIYIKYKCCNPLKCGNSTCTIHILSLGLDLLFNSPFQQITTDCSACVLIEGSNRAKITFGFLIQLSTEAIALSSRISLDDIHLLLRGVVHSQYLGVWRRPCGSMQRFTSSSCLLFSVVLNKKREIVVFINKTIYIKPQTTSTCVRYR